MSEKKIGKNKDEWSWSKDRFGKKILIPNRGARSRRKARGGK